MNYTNGVNNHKLRLVNNSQTLDYTKIRDKEEVEVKYYLVVGRNYNLKADSCE